MVVNQAGQRHRRSALLGRRQHQANIFQAQLQSKSGRLELLLRDDPPVVRNDLGSQ